MGMQNNTVTTLTPLSTVIRPTNRMIRISPEYYQGLESHPDREAIIEKVKEESIQFQKAKLAAFNFTQENGETTIHYWAWRDGDYVKCLRVWQGAGKKTARKAAKALAFGGDLPPEKNTRQTRPPARYGYRPTGWERS